MDQVVKILQPYQLHPIVDHFSVALLFVAVLIDVVGSMSPTRIWLRYTALTLMILGALAAGGSYFTGDMEADRIWNALGQPARDVLHRHAQLGQYLAITFGVLAIWRIMIQGFGFMAGSRAIYLIVAILAVATLGYSAHLGGVLVYDYGAGTALMAAAPVPSEGASPASETSPAGPIPTVTVPTTVATATPMVTIAPPAATPASNPTPVPTVQPSGAATTM